MATQKTLAPTNQTITIAAFQGEKPDQRQMADAEGKLADAVNALNSQLFTNKADTTLIDLVKTFNTGTYNFRLDNATDGPVSSGGVVYKVVKTHGVNDTRCSIVALPMASDAPVYSAFVGQNATSISWNKLPKFVMVEETKTTGATGNIATGYQASNKIVVCGAIALNADCYLRAWRPTGNGEWYLTAVNPNTGATVNSTSLNIRYLVITLN